MSEVKFNNRLNRCWTCEHWKYKGDPDLDAFCMYLSSEEDYCWVPTYHDFGCRGFERAPRKTVADRKALYLSTLVSERKKKEEAAEYQRQLVEKWEQERRDRKLMEQNREIWGVGHGVNL